MKQYYLTVFEANGKLVEEKKFEAVTDQEAKNEALNFIVHEGYENKTYRYVSSDANLLLFHR